LTTFFIHKQRAAHEGENKKHRMTNDKLQALINFYEEEKKTLERTISDYVQQMEFEFAHFHTGALRELDSKLRSLYRLAEGATEEQEDNNLSLCSGSFASSALIERRPIQFFPVTDETAKVDANLLAEQSHETVLDHALRQLFDGQIAGFILVIDENAGLEFHFSLLSKKLKIAIPVTPKLSANGLITDRSSAVLRELGFVGNENKTRMVVLIPGSQGVIEKELKWRLSKLVFEVFNRWPSERKSFIKLKPKRKV